MRWAVFVLCLAVTSAATEPHGAVATDHPLATEVGARILRQGGNAIDAAVAAALALGVLNPAGSGLGGGGFLVAWVGGHAHALDFREAAPAAVSRSLYLDAHDHVVSGRSTRGGLAVAVPGEAAGLAEAAHLWGALPWRALVEPARRLADEGFPCGPHLAAQAAEIVPRLPPDHPMLAWLAPDGSAIAAGQLVRRPALGRTLARLADDPSALSKGDLAAAVVETVRLAGGVLSLADLAGYRPIERPPAKGRYRGVRLLAAGAPSGGPTVIEALQILDALGAWPDDPATALHREIEALKHAFAGRPTVGDPSFLPDVTGHLTSPALARRLAGRIGERVIALDAYGASGPFDHGTSHLCVADGAGNGVALTTTVNTAFGAWLEAAGVVLNDEMDDFSFAAGVPNTFGLASDSANTVAPGRRPRSSMSPLLLLDERGLAGCAGGSGGPMIISGTVQVVANLVDRGMSAVEAVGAPRLHTQLRPDLVVAEPAMPAVTLAELRRRGHHAKRFAETVFGKLPPPAEQVLWRRAGRWEAASDPRKHGEAITF